MKNPSENGGKEYKYILCKDWNHRATVTRKATAVTREAIETASDVRREPILHPPIDPRIAAVTNNLDLATARITKPCEVIISLEGFICFFFISKSERVFLLRKKYLKRLYDTLCIRMILETRRE